jgi:hypothetical protein
METQTFSAVGFAPKPETSQMALANVIRLDNGKLAFEPTETTPEEERILKEGAVAWRSYRLKRQLARSQASNLSRALLGGRPMMGDFGDSARQWREERDKSERRNRRYRTLDDEPPPDPSNGADHDQPLPKLTPIPYIEGEIIPPQEWLVEPWIPMEGHATLFQGDGGYGKSTIGQQLQSSCATELPWLGLNVKGCASVGFYTEDTKKVLLRRQADIDRAYGLDCRSPLAMHRMHLFARRGLDNELVVFTRYGAPERRPFFWQVREAALDLHSRLLVLDVAVDLFGGDEISRRQVRHFANILNELAGEIDGAVFLSAHLSQAAIKSDGGHSGSTDWNNAFKSRVYLSRPKPPQDNGKDNSDEPADTNGRPITRKKANFATIGETIKLHWERGVFLPDSFTSSPFRSSVDDVFLALLDAVIAEGQNVSPKPRAWNYAPALFMTRPPKDRGGYQREDFRRAMQSLLKDRKIKIAPYGSPSADTKKLVRVDSEGVS